MKKDPLAANKPTSFSLDPEVLKRLKDVCHALDVTKTSFVAEAIVRLAAKVESGDVRDLSASRSSAEPPPEVLQLPGIFEGLSNDEVWLVHQLANILRERPQGDVFALLEASLQKAVRRYVADSKQRLPPSAPRRLGTLPPRAESAGKLQSGLSQIAVPEADIPWIELLLRIRHSRKPGLPVALQNNLHEFAWADEAWEKLSEREAPPVSAAAAGTGRRRDAPSELPAVIGAGGHRAGDEERTSNVGARLDALEKAKEASDHRAEPAPRKTRKRR